MSRVGCRAEGSGDGRAPLETTLIRVGNDEYARTIRPSLHHAQKRHARSEAEFVSVHGQK